MEILFITLFQIAIYILIMFWCYKLAEKKGRSKKLALLFGLLFGIFAVIGYLLIGKKENNKN
ncbi:MAG TPA: hypothetical protein PKV21_07675 [bacterium]|nr:hypothetical protein [bacterium]